MGDIVSVAVRHFGEDYARTRGNGRWASDNIRDEGEVLEKKDGNVKVKFKDGEALVRKEAPTHCGALQGGTGSRCSSRRSPGQRRHQRGGVCEGKR